MLQRNFRQDLQSPILNLPDELLISILMLNKKKNLKEIARISKRFHHIVNTVFRDTLYGRCLQFDAWQKNKINGFKKSIEDFISSNRLGLLNRPDLNRTYKKLYYSALAVILFSLVASVSLLSFEIFNKSTNASMTPLWIGEILLFSVVLATIGFAYVMSRSRDNYAISTLTQSHLDQLLAIINTHNEIIGEKVSCWIYLFVLFTAKLVRSLFKSKNKPEQILDRN